MRGRRSRGLIDLCIFLPFGRIPSHSCTCIGRCSRNCNRLHCVPPNRVNSWCPRPRTISEASDLPFQINGLNRLKHLKAIHPFPLLFMTPGKQIRVGPTAHILYVFRQLPCGAANVKSSENLSNNGIIGLGNSTTVGSFVRDDQGL